MLVGAWLSEELATINQIRLAGGERPLDPLSDRSVRARVVADLTGAGPLEPYINDASVEEIDVNSHESTWVTFVDGRKLDVGSAVVVGGRADGVPEAPRPTDDPHR